MTTDPHLVRTKVRILKGVTIADVQGYTPGDGDPPTFAPGDIVKVGGVTANDLVDMGKAEYLR